MSGLEFLGLLAGGAAIFLLGWGAARRFKKPGLEGLGKVLALMPICIALAAMLGWAAAKQNKLWSPAASEQSEQDKAAVKGRGGE